MSIDGQYVRRVVKVYTASRDRMGDFPLPDYEVVTATEILKHHLTQGAHSHAVEVARVSRSGRYRYVFANSGAPGALQANIDLANAELRKTLGAGHLFVQVKRGSDFYEPLHSSVDTLLAKVRADFDPAIARVRLSDVRTVIANFRAQFIDYGSGERPLSGMHERQRSHLSKTIKFGRAARSQNPGGFGTSQSLVDRSALIKSGMRAPGNSTAHKNAAEAFFAGLAALRLRMVRPADREAIINAYRTLGTWMTQQKVRPWLPIFATHITVLLRPGDAVITPATQLPMRGVQQKVDQVYQALNQSRFCAEPRVFGAIRQDGDARGHLVSQACIWFTGHDGTANPGGYQVIGPQATPDDASQSGSYMWACSSCRARSTLMLSGITRSVAKPRYHEV